MFIGRIDAEAEAPILWLLDSKSPLPGTDCRQEKGAAEDEMVR